MNARILVVDDDLDWRNLLSGELCQAGFKVTQASTGAEALACCQVAHFDLMILDVQLPDCDGKEVCFTVRQQKDYVPIIMISGVNKEDIDQESGLDIGANHYFKKPVSTRVVVAQVRALLKMTSALKNQESNDWLEIDDYLRIHLKRHLIIKGGERVELTPQEFKLLVCLSQNMGEVVTADDLARTVWEDRLAVGKAPERLKGVIKRLRRKIEPDPRHPRYLLTARGDGYYLCLDSKSD
jgi:two-component system alkaline phosphatase synthesis response regulator PhoP